jgi:hypothetical protein
MVEEDWPEHKAGHCRDPYMVIAEKAGATLGERCGRLARHTTSLFIALTMYGVATAVTVVMATFLQVPLGLPPPLPQNVASAIGLQLALCIWTVIVAAALAPLTWLGTPKDLWCAPPTLENQFS